MKVIFTFIVCALALAGAGACAIGSDVAPTLVSPDPPTVQAPPPSSPPSQPNNGGGTTFVLTESDLNEQMARGMNQGEISNARVDIHPNNLADFTATVRTGSLTLQPTVSIQLSVRNGRMEIEVIDVQVGGFGVPSSLIEPQIAQIEQTAERELNRLLSANQDSTGQTLQSLSTTEDSLTLYFAP